jgi:hypothetical protein
MRKPGTGLTCFLVRSSLLTSSTSFRMKEAVVIVRNARSECNFLVRSGTFVSGAVFGSVSVSSDRFVRRMVVG